MWSLLAKLSPLLLSSTSPSTSTISTQSTATPTTATTIIPATWPPQKASDLTNRFRQLYRELEHPGPISKHMTPTLRFSYVPPPISDVSLHDDSSSWILLDEESLEDERKPNSSKPLAVYLPGLDGYGISARTHQFDDLSRTFEFWRLTVLPDDRSSFLQVVDAITNFIQYKTGDRSNSRRVVLIGESCGGLLASAVAHRLRSTNALKGLVLVNPATSFDQTSWDTLIPLITSLQYLDNREHPNEGLSPYAILGSLLLSGLVPDNDQLARIWTTITNLPNLTLTDPNQLREMFHAMTDAFRGTEERLPPAVLEHRVIKWLVPGTSAINSRLSQIQVPTLVVAGDQDRLVPSVKEANRLAEILPHAEKLIVRGRGHFVLDDTVNLTEAILFSNIDPLEWKATKRRYDPIMDWKVPTRQQFTKVIRDSVQPLRAAFSPVFFSTDEKGKRWLGLGKIPRPKGPLLFVANHQFAALDLRLFMGELIEQRNIFPRGLAHPITFPPNQERNELNGRTPGLVNGGQPNPFNGDFETFGAVVVTPRNYYRLMQSGQDALLFPGGAKEALSGRKDYPLFWPDKVDFVRTASRFNATIVPLSAIGVVDSVNVLAELEDVFELPFVGERAKAASQNVTSARYDERNEDELFGFPLFTPGLPSRNYFLFGKPIRTDDIDPNDKEACAMLYDEVQSEVRSGLDDLLQARQRDPFRSSPKRLVYEQVFGKKAPTFPVDELNRK